MVRILIFLCLMVFACPSCNYDNCSKNLGFKLDYYLFDEIRVSGDDYCALVNKSLNGDRQAILDLSKLETYDGASYQHGAVLIEVIDKISEQKFLNVVESLKADEKRNLYFSLAGGLDYTRNVHFEGKRIEVAFPLLTKKIFVPSGISLYR